MHRAALGPARAPAIFKDAFHEYIVDGKRESGESGAESAPRPRHVCAIPAVPAGESVGRSRLRLDAPSTSREALRRFRRDVRPRAAARRTSSTRTLQNDIANADARARAAAGVRRHDLEQAVLSLRRARWLDGDPAPAAAAAERATRAAISDWPHLNNADIISMPDKWEYPWYAAWDLAFHCIPLALIDPEFAKEQLVLLTREWYMHPNGQLPAYEWAFGDVNPPVHAWAAWRVFQIDRKQRGGDGDLRVSRTRVPQAAAELHLVGEPQGRARAATSSRAASSASTTSASSTAARPAHRRLHRSGRRHRWMAMYCLNLMRIALELAHAQSRLRGHRHQVLRALPVHRRRDEQHGRRTASASGTRRTSSTTTCCICRTASSVPLKVRSMVGLIPLFAVETLEPELLEKLPGFHSAAGVVSRASARSGQPGFALAGRRAAASGACCRCCAAIA